MAIINGTSGDDHLVGTNGQDTINGLGGNDVLDGRGDTVRTSDVLNGGEGNDVFYGDGSFDAGVDIFVGGTGDDEYHPTNNRGQDMLFGPHYIREDAGGGYDTILIVGDYILDINHTASNHSGAFYIEKIAVADPTTTTPILIAGSIDAQTLIGNAGPNIIYARGADIVQGLGGDDVYYSYDATDRVYEAAGEGYDTIRSRGSYELQPAQHIEQLEFQNPLGGAGFLFGNELAQTIIGNAGANLIAGGGGADTLIGRGGDDTYIVTDVTAQVWEAADEGLDLVRATVSYALTSGQYVERLALDDAAAFTPLDLFGNELAQAIAGNAGANLIAGRGGADTLIGRGGDDIYIVTDASARVWEAAGEGLDLVRTTVSYALEWGEHIERLALDDAAAVTPLELYGNELAQAIAGNAGDNLLWGRGGADTLIGRGGNDTYIVTDAAARVWEAAGEGLDTVRTTVSFALEAGQHVERLLFDDAAATTALNLTGNELAQAIAGNAGDNRIDGGAGADTLIGREGADSFAFTTALGGGNVDWLLDFDPAADTILLEDTVFAGVAPGALSADAFVIGTAAADASDRIIYDATAGQLWFDADGSGAGAAVLFATLGAGLPLTAADFVVI